jgi:hypothetical protein
VFNGCYSHHQIDLSFSEFLLFKIFGKKIAKASKALVYAAFFVI